MTKRSIEAMLDFLSPVSLIPGMGEKRIAALKESDIETIGDILYHFPKKYIDRSSIIPLSDLKKHINELCTVRGIVERILVEPGRRNRLKVRLVDDFGSVELVWFQGLQFYKRSLKTGMTIIATGKVTIFRQMQIIHPLIEILKNTDKPIKLFIPQYSITSEMRVAGIQQKLFQNTIEWILSRIKHFPRVLPEYLEKKYKYPPLEECIHRLHQPLDSSDPKRYRRRIIYEEMYKTAVTIHWNRKKLLLPGRSMTIGSYGKQFRNLLPFKLTADQEAAVEVLCKDAASNNRMHRLLQGDVGCGKTLVAFYSCLPALNSGFQVAWLAPTEILAQQTYKTVSSWLETLGFNVGFLSSASPGSEKRLLLEQLASGTVHFIIGTHALLQPVIKFNSLGMIVIDEQHKFGVEQRRLLLEKDPSSDFLLMSATPIPQSLVQTVYGDLDCVTIRKGPSGRLPVSTHYVPPNKRIDMERFALDQIKDGGRIFYVVPRIENDDEDEMAAVMDVESAFNKLTKGTFSDVSVGYLHGKMDSGSKSSAMSDFAVGKFDVLVATSIIEVGIDIPEATIIIIENANYFGLAQLHQLRGRVGRGPKKSWCFLLSESHVESDTLERLKMFSKNHNGFAIAELDLKYRGPGQLQGVQQSGWGDSIMASIVNNPSLFKEIQQDIELLMESNSSKSC